MDDDVCHDRRCWASVNGHFTGDVLEGGRVDATTWPVQPQQAIDIYFDGKDATYPAGYYRGVIDTATTPSKTGIQKLDVDFPDDRTSARLDLKRSQIYDPGTEPAEPGVADGEVARVVRAADLPDADVSATPYGLTVDQVRVIKDLYYGDFHYAGRDRLYELLKERARKDGKLEERTIKRKDGEVTVSTPYGIRYRQLQQYLAAMEHRQLHKRPTKVKTTRSFVTPIAPMRRLMADTMDLGKAGGGRAGTQRYVIGIIDPSSKWVHAEVFQGKAPREEQTRQVLVNGLKSLRDGLLAHKTGNSAQVFDDKGALLHTLVFASDNGNEFKGGFTEAARKDLVDAGLITGADRFIHRYNLASAPTQAAHIERLWSTLRTKLKLAAQAEFGGITRKAAKDARRETYSTRDQKEGLGTYGQSKNAQGWTTWVRRAIEAVNAERAVGTDIAPNDYLGTYVTRGKAALERKTAEGADAELDAKGERQLKHQEELTVNTMVRRLDLAKAKASLKDKFAPNWSTEVFRVVKVTKQRSKGLGNASFLTNNALL